MLTAASPAGPAPTVQAQPARGPRISSTHLLRGAAAAVDGGANAARATRAVAAARSSPLLPSAARGPAPLFAAASDRRQSTRQGGGNGTGAKSASARVVPSPKPNTAGNTHAKHDVAAAAVSAPPSPLRTASPSGMPATEIYTNDGRPPISIGGEGGSSSGGGNGSGNTSALLTLAPPAAPPAPPTTSAPAVPDTHTSHTSSHTSSVGASLAAGISSVSSSGPPATSSPSYDTTQGWQRQLHHPTRAQLWEAIRVEAWNDAMAEPALASFMYSSVLSQTSLDKALAFVLSNKLGTTVLGSVQLMELFQEAYDTCPDIVDSAVADLLTVRDRDPACSKYSQALLFFKGYQAIQCFRVQHWLWQRGRKTLALAIQSRVFEIFHVDIHPNARIGKGALIDHGTGVVIGETAVLGDNVSLLHRVCLGGTGTGKTVRHPTLGNGVLLGAGVSVLGPVVIGAGSKVGAGSVVVSDIPAHCVSVGVPAAVIKRDIQGDGLPDMDSGLGYYLDFVI